MAELELTEEYLREEGSWVSSNDATWRKVDEEIIDYDEGYLTTNYVWQNKVSGRYYSFTEASNSWDESGYGLNEDGFQIEEVEPVEVTVIQYRAKKQDV
jgi:hypothetical protein